MTDETGNGVRNSEVEPEQDMALLAINYARRILPIEKDMKSLGEDVRGIIGEGKTNGVKAKYIRLAQKMLKVEDETVIAEEMRVMMYLMKALNIGGGYQMDLFEDRRPLEDKAGDQGYADGLAGKSLVNPHHPGTDQYTRYAERWHEAQGELGKAMERRMEAAEAAKKAKAEADAAGKTGGGEVPTDDELATVQGVASDMAKRADKNKAIVDAAAKTKPKGKSNAEKAAEMVKAADAKKAEEASPSESVH